MTADPPVQPASRRPTRPRISPEALFMAVLAAVVATVVLISFLEQQYEAWVAGVALLGCAVLVWRNGWWRTKPAIAAGLMVDVMLVFAYLWSLDDRIRVSIRASPQGYIATVDQSGTVLQTHTHSGRIGLYAGRHDDYYVLWTGEAIPPPATTPFERFGEWLRFAAPGTAWNGQSIQPAGLRRYLSASPTTFDGTWRPNRRGELEGTPGSYLLYPSATPGTFTYSVNMMRGDGTQGVLVGVDRSGRGYLLAIRIDRSDALWVRWNNGKLGKVLGEFIVRVPTLPMLQRDVRLLLSNVIAAMILLLVAVLLYIPLAQALGMLSGSDDDVDAIERTLLRPYVSDTLAAVAAVAVVVSSSLVATRLLGGLPHVQDSVAYLFQAKTLALGRLSVPAPKSPHFFLEEFINVYRGRWFGKYPPGWPLLLAFGQLVHIPSLVNPVLTGINIFLIYVIGRAVYGPIVGLLAALLTATSPFVVFMGGSFMSHPASLCFLLGFVYLTIRWVQGVEGRSSPPSDWRLLGPAGFLLGMAFITRQIDAVVFALPFAGLLLSRPVARRVLALRWLVLGAIVPLLFLLYYNWNLTGNALTSPYAIWDPRDHPGFGPSVLYDHSPGQGFLNTSLNLEMLFAHLFGWPFFLTLSLAVMPFLVGRAGRWDVIFAVSSLAVIGAYVFYFTPGIMYGPRYYYVAVPWFALLTARGLQELYWWPFRLPLGAVDRTAALIFPVLLVTSLVLFDLRTYIPIQAPIYQGYNSIRTDPVDAVHAAGVHHAIVFVVSPPLAPWNVYGETFSSNSPLLDNDVIYARDAGAEDKELMDQYPDRSYYRLDNLQLTRISP